MFLLGEDLGRTGGSGAVHAPSRPVPAPFHGPALSIGQVDEALAGKKRAPHKGDYPFHSRLGLTRRLRPVGGMRSKG